MTSQERLSSPAEEGLSLSKCVQIGNLPAQQNPSFHFECPSLYHSSKDFKIIVNILEH